VAASLQIPSPALLLRPSYIAAATCNRRADRGGKPGTYFGTDALAASAGIALSSAQMSTELAMRRPGMAFQRTRMAADRTLIGGHPNLAFAHKVWAHHLPVLQQDGDSEVLKGVAPPRNFGISLVLLILLLLIGVAAAFSMIAHVGPLE